MIKLIYVVVFLQCELSHFVTENTIILSYLTFLAPMRVRIVPFDIIENTILYRTIY